MFCFASSETSSGDGGNKMRLDGMGNICCFEHPGATIERVCKLSSLIDTLARGRGLLLLQKHKSLETFITLSQP